MKPSALQYGQRANFTRDEIGGAVVLGIQELPV